MKGKFKNRTVVKISDDNPSPITYKVKEGMVLSTYRGIKLGGEKISHLDLCYYESDVSDYEIRVAKKSFQTLINKGYVVECH